MRHALLVGVVALTLAGCGGKDGSPTAPDPDPTPTPTTYALTGQVADSTTGQGIGGATIRIGDGPDAGKTTTTNGSGQYAFPALQRAGFTASASARYYNPQAQGVNLISNVTQNFVLAPIPLFSRSGTGDTVFDMPTSVSRIKITADYTRNSSNFVVYIGGRLIVNELIGTGWSTTHFEGTYLTNGGVTEIKLSSGVRWSFLEVR